MAIHSSLQPLKTHKFTVTGFQDLNRIKYPAVSKFTITRVVHLINAVTGR